jgi:CubicO group peptidase (beta-lactamase class C family)
MAAAVLQGNRIVATGAAGVREKGKEARVLPTDRFHLGSCTKAMTATLCGMLVEDGLLSWSRTLGEAFPDVKMDPKWRRVTLEQLLVQRSGVPGDVPDPLWERLLLRRGTAAEQRRTLVEGLLAGPPDHDPGTTFVYSNANYALAGAMAESAAKRPWEDLLRERLLKPLGMESAGFGAPGDPRTLDDPRGHGEDGTPVEPGPGADNPPAIAPAGAVHASLPDWAKFASLHLDAARGRPRLLKRETFARLHEAPKSDGDGYAMGWIVRERDGSMGRLLAHAGSNTMWYADLRIFPERDLVVLVAANQGGDVAERACEDASVALLGDHLGRTKTPEGR